MRRQSEQGLSIPVGMMLGEHAGHRVAIGDIHADVEKIVAIRQPRQTRLFQLHVVVGIEVIHPDDLITTTTLSCTEKGSLEFAPYTELDEA